MSQTEGVTKLVDCFLKGPFKEEIIIAGEPVKLLPQKGKGNDRSFSHEICLAKDEVKIWYIEVYIYDP